MRFEERGERSGVEERIARREAKASLLDSVTREVGRFQKTLPTSDKQRLSDYLEDIREIERRIQNATKSNTMSPDAQVPAQGLSGVTMFPWSSVVA